MPEICIATANPDQSIIGKPRKKPEGIRLETDQGEVRLWYSAIPNSDSNIDTVSFRWFTFCMFKDFGSVAG